MVNDRMEIITGKIANSRFGEVIIASFFDFCYFCFFIFMRPIVRVSAPGL